MIAQSSSFNRFFATFFNYLPRKTRIKLRFNNNQTHTNNVWTNQFGINVWSLPLYHLSLPPSNEAFMDLTTKYAKIKKKTHSKRYMHFIVNDMHASKPTWMILVSSQTTYIFGTTLSNRAYVCVSTWTIQSLHTFARCKAACWEKFQIREGKENSESVSDREGN